MSGWLNKRLPVYLPDGERWVNDSYVQQNGVIIEECAAHVKDRVDARTCNAAEYNAVVLGVVVELLATIIDANDAMDIAGAIWSVVEPRPNRDPSHVKVLI